MVDNKGKTPLIRHIQKNILDMKINNTILVLCIHKILCVHYANFILYVVCPAV